MHGSCTYLSWRLDRIDVKVVVCLAAIAALLQSAASSVGASGTAEPALDVGAPRTRIQLVVDELRGRLALAEAVDVTLVPHNPLLVSVSTPLPGHTAYRLSFEAGFAETLDSHELSAVVAHELGHIWIYTHHPYLQTERLANRIALRVVERPVLERVYEKVWKRSGQKGDLSRFIAP
ncbi:MAG: hypothetical protein AB7I50_23500 [Vicinamibacterales bacterium]